MRKTSAFFISGLLVLGLAAPAWAANSEPAAQSDADPQAVSLSEISATEARSNQFEPNRHGSDRDRHRRHYYRDGRWHYHDGRYYYYRDGRWYYGDGRYYYRDGRWHYDDRYRYGHPHYRGGPTRHCHDGEWRYHPRAGWMFLAGLRGCSPANPRLSSGVVSSRCGGAFLDATSDRRGDHPVTFHAGMPYTLAGASGVLPRRDDPPRLRHGNRSPGALADRSPTPLWCSAPTPGSSP
jgi:hypothetical protein